VNEAHALLFALMVMTVSLAGCFGGDDGDSNDETSSEKNDVLLVKVNDIVNVNGSTGGLSKNPTELTAIGDTLYFRATESRGTGGETGLWKSDGTANGTVIVNNFILGSPSDLTAVGNTLYFEAYDATNGNELWKSDGTANGTVMVKDINDGSHLSRTPYSRDSNPYGLTAIGNTLYFAADDGYDTELWKSDGTANGTVIVKGIYSGGGTNPQQLTAVGNTLYFQADDGTNGTELWKSDGTANGTMMVKDINSGSNDSYPVRFTAIGTTLYFRADDGNNGYELWKSDGTTSGTVMVKDIDSGSGSSYPGQITAVGNTIYFSADDGTNGGELWKSDGTASGTLMVKDINSGSIVGGGGSSSPYDLTAVGNTLYFRAYDGTNGMELWKSDGTALGTMMVKDINSGSGSSEIDRLAAVGNTLYFRADDGTNGGELWKSDGTANGTVMVKNIRSGSDDSYPRYLTAVGNTLYFRATDQPASATSIAELWVITNVSALNELDDFPLDDSEDAGTDGDGGTGGDGDGDYFETFLGWGPTKQEAKFQTQMIGGGIMILLIALGALIFFKRKGSLPESIKEISAMDTNVMVPTNIGMGTPLTHPLPLQIRQEPLATPNAATPAHQVDTNGYEWLTHLDGSKWYRIAQSNSQWTKFE
jgi:ELWxxDGT repeat protein